MKKYKTELKCLHCDNKIERKVYNYSLKKFFFPLCYVCQNWVADTVKTNDNVTLEAKYLSFALKERDIVCELEHFDGYKHIDVFIPSHNLYFEVDGLQHSTNSDQALTDLLRTGYSLATGRLTIRIPNILIIEKLAETGDAIVEILNHLDEWANQVKLVCDLTELSHKLSKLLESRTITKEVRYN
jgi:hypothetical protein